MADETPRDDEPTAAQPGEPVREPADEAAGTPPAERPLEEEPEAEQTVGDEPAVEEQPAPEQAPPEEPSPARDRPASEEAAPPAAEAPAEEAPAAEEPPVDEEPVAPREKPAIPGLDLEIDIVAEGVDPLALQEAEEAEEAAAAAEEEERLADQPIAAATIDLAAGARYRATGKRKTAVARVILKPGTGAYTINGRNLEAYFPRTTLQRNIRQPLEAVGYDDRMDVIARMHGSGVSAQAGALRHGISRALLEADPNLRGELKRRGFLTRDSRAKERKKAGLKKARKRPQFSKR